MNRLVTAVERKVDWNRLIHMIVKTNGGKMYACFQYIYDYEYD